VTQSEVLLALQATALVAAGLVLGFLLRLLTGRLLRVAVRYLPGTLGRLIGTPTVEGPATGVISNTVFWAIFLLFVGAATQLLGVPILGPGLAAIGAYLPRVAAMVVIVMLGLLLAELARTAVARAAASARILAAPLLGRLVQLVILLVTAVVSFEQLGIQTTFIVVIVGIALAALLVGAAIAFGLGARTAVSNILASYYLVRTYRSGQRVRIGAVEGRIVEITPTAVVLRTADGEALVPAKEFGEQVSLLITDER
jgi:small-conductance mechanosensitive channel